MFAEKRHMEILKLLEEKNSVTVQELKELLDASEATIRRDLTTLHNSGKLEKVFGGAVNRKAQISTMEYEVSYKKDLNKEEKLRVAKHAASLIKKDDFVYLDAGTTTAYMIDFLTKENAVYVTNAVDHAKRMAARGLKVILIGGRLKASTEAVVGSEALTSLQKYYFTIGFFGTNGIDREAGYTTPDTDEAAVKECAMKHTHNKYIITDHSKFDCISPVCFGAYGEAVILTDELPEGIYAEDSNIITVPESYA